MRELLSSVMLTSLFNTASQASSLLLPRKTIHIHNTRTDPCNKPILLEYSTSLTNSQAVIAPSFPSFDGRVFILLLASRAPSDSFINLALSSSLPELYEFGKVPFETAFGFHSVRSALFDQQPPSLHNTPATSSSYHSCR